MGLLALIVVFLMGFPLVHTHSLFTCEPITVPRCLGMSYNMTFFPNMMGHYDQDAAAVKMEPFFPLMNLHCSPEVHTFLCKAFIPVCTDHDCVVQPCRSLCEQVYSDCQNLIHTFGITWPEELECDKLENCGDTLPGTILPTSKSHSIPKTPELQRDYGFWCPRQLKTTPGQGSVFLTVNDCAPPCPNMYFKSNELDFAKSFIGIFSIFCLCATLFTFLTFLIDVRRFRYPERPIIFYAVCYSIVSLMYFVGFLLGNSTACSTADEKLGTTETVVIGSQNKACTVLFMILYFFTMAGTVWWVILTITWFLAAGPKWSCEAIEKKAVWYHTAAWGSPGILTVMLLAMNKVEGDNISGVCYVGLYDLAALRYFVLVPLCLCVVVGLSLLLAGIISLNHVRQVIQHDGRNQEKLKKFMIRIGVFSGLYLVPLVALLGCYIYEQAYRTAWESTWIFDHCQEYHIPCPSQVKSMTRPDLSLFMMKYVMTLIMGISAVFWVGSKKTCSEWANFFNRNRKRDPISESRRVLQESCEFFLKHNSKVQHKKKHYKSSSHKLKVISKSMGTSTGRTANHGTSVVAITNHDSLAQGSFTEPKPTPEIAITTVGEHSITGQKINVDGGEPSTQVISGRTVSLDLQEKRSSKAGSTGKVSSQSESMQRIPDGRLSPRNDFGEGHPLQSNQAQRPNCSRSSSIRGSVPLLMHSAPDTKDKDLGKTT
ncbi:frizzled-6 [Latimeria chalumnae]|uniref:Frizzled-6 n=1 Tax=Latimeria chalumnae TaxID=7897 RepID=H3B2R2_LATCH|nr:PREDICTED: frizzled-6 [Latimeria chalumnae]|eukprot:XP_006000469.1 PREDICTED: frizzled-6 [Latimeria chalumnae]